MDSNPLKKAQKDFDLIDRYLSENLNENEIQDFVNRLNSDATFKQNFEEQQVLSEAIEEQVLANKLNDFHKETTSKVISINPNSFYKKISIAASIVVLIGVGGYLFFNQQTTNEKIFASYFNPDPGLATTMGTTTQFQFLDAMVDYKQGKYSKAIQKWQPLLNYNPQNDSLNYFIGVAHLAKGEEDLAIKYLKIVTKNSTSIFNKDAYFYLGLAFIKSGDFEPAKKYLSFSETKISKQIIADLEN